MAILARCIIANTILALRQTCGVCDCPNLFEVCPGASAGHFCGSSVPIQFSITANEYKGQNTRN